MSAKEEEFGDEFFVVKATPDDFNEMLNFIQLDFCKNEPLTNALEATPEEMQPLFKDLVKNSLQEPCFSYIVRSKISNAIVAVRMMGTLTRPSEAESSKEECPSYPSWKPNTIAKLLGAMEKKIWEILPNVQKLASGIMISVHENYTRRGIAQKLVVYNYAEMKEAGCEGIVREATAKNSQKLFEKLGYQKLYEILHSDYKENGKQVFQCRDGTDRAVLVFMPF